MASFRWLFITLSLVACDGPSNYAHHNLAAHEAEAAVGTGKNSPESLVGEKFFRENRFSQYFYAHSVGDYNSVPSQGDPVVDVLEAPDRLYANPYKGQAISCAACHYVDQNKAIANLGVRAYTDFSPRSAIPDRGDGLTRTVRRSPNMVGTALNDGMFLHHDGEFARPEDLVKASMLGRNMGWLPNESDEAQKHIVEVVRKDTGAYPTDTDLSNLSYKDLLAGNANIPARFQIPENLRLNIDGASDQQIMAAMVNLVGRYLRSLDFGRDERGYYNGSPYDLFLRKNALPLSPSEGESALQYSQRLYMQLLTGANWQFVNERDGQFKVQKQAFVFSDKELAGLKVFFGQGKCIQCHAAPDFSDHILHNTGVSQFEYEQIHGAGTFTKLKIPDLEERDAQAQLYLPPSVTRPKAASLLRSQPILEDPRRADLGVWIVFKNPAIPNPQAFLRPAICKVNELNCAKTNDQTLLRASVGLMKTPTVRDLGQSWPYLHTGQASTIENVLQLYIQFSAMAREGRIRNPDPVLSSIELKEEDIENVASFLKALNEDYN